MRSGMILLVVLMLSVFSCMPAMGQEVVPLKNFLTIDGAADYEMFSGSLLFWPDESGGIGIAGLTDSAIPGETERNFAIGPCVKFDMTGLVDTVIGTIIPGAWKPSEGVPAKPYGKLAGLWETERHNLIGEMGMEWHLFPDRKVHPVVATELIVPEGSADALDREWRVMIGASIRIGGK